MGENEGSSTRRGPEEGSGASDESMDEASNPLELFFDLVFVFAFTRVTAFVSHELTWVGMLQGLALLAVLWWGWVTYSWLMDTTPAETLLSERVAILVATAGMFVVALAVPNAFGDTAILFGVAYFAVRALHVGVSVVTTDFETRARFLKLVPGFLGGPALLVVAGFVDDPLRAGLWVAGIAIDYGVLFVRGVAKFDVRVGHFVERYRDIVIIALGESILAMGFALTGDDTGLSPQVVAAALLGIALVAALGWLYFDYVSLAAEARFVSAEGYERGVLARNLYAYLHFPIIAGIISVALGLEKTVTHVGEPLGAVPAVALYGGSALYLIGHAAFHFHALGSVSITRLVAAGVACVSIAMAVRVSALAAIAALAGLLVGLAAFETAFSSRRRDTRGE